MQAPPSQAVDDNSEQMQERWVPVPSRLELELRCRIGMMEIDRGIEVQRGDEYRRMMLAMVGAGGGYSASSSGQLLPAPRPAPAPVPVPVPEREIMPVPALGPSSSSSSSPSELVPSAPAALTAVPYGHGAVAQAGPASSATWERYWALSRSFVPSSSTSQLSDASGSCSSRRGRGRGRGRGGRGRGGPDRAGAVVSSTTRRLQLVGGVLLAVCICPLQLTFSID